MFLQEHNPILFDDLVLTEQLFPHLYEVQEIAEKRVEVIMAGFLSAKLLPNCVKLIFQKLIFVLKGKKNY